MIVAGLTGSIGMGKTTTAQMFRDMGIPVFDSDAEVHDLYRTEAVAAVEKAFPGVTEAGVINRQKLGERVIGNPEAFKRLEAIVHPLVRKRERDFRKQAEAAGNQLVVLDIPLLLETGRQESIDVLIVVSASADVQRRRVLERKGMTREKFEVILSRQVPDEDKRRQADFVIDTGSGLETARKQVQEIIETLRHNQ